MSITNDNNIRQQIRLLVRLAMKTVAFRKAQDAALNAQFAAEPSLDASNAKWLEYRNLKRQAKPLDDACFKAHRDWSDCADGARAELEAACETVAASVADPGIWEIRWLLPSPSMSQQSTLFSGSYQEACEEARRVYSRERRSTGVYSAFSTSPWFTIDSRGETDRNTCGTPPVFKPHKDSSLAAKERLAQAAPDLLEACESLLDALCGPGEAPDQAAVDFRCQQARKAISKAKGGAA